MTMQEADDYSSIATIVEFMQSLSASVPMPPVNRKFRQIFISKFRRLTSELDSIKHKIDLAEIILPGKLLFESEVTDKALSSTYKFIRQARHKFRLPLRRSYPRKLVHSWRMLLDTKVSNRAK